MNKDGDEHIGFWEFMNFVQRYYHYYDTNGDKVKDIQGLLQESMKDFATRNQILIEGNKMSYPDGSVYEGDIVDEKRQGFGSFQKNIYFLRDF